jgi:hypothetical protein
MDECRVCNLKQKRMEQTTTTEHARPTKHALDESCTRQKWLHGTTLNQAIQWSCVALIIHVLPLDATVHTGAIGPTRCRQNAIQCKRSGQQGSWGGTLNDVQIDKNEQEVAIGTEKKLASCAVRRKSKRQTPMQRRTNTPSHGTQFIKQTTELINHATTSRWSSFRILPVLLWCAVFNRTQRQLVV